MTSFGSLYRNQSNIDFVPLWRKGLMLSTALVTISLLALLLRGFNLGIDFEGGTAWTVPAADVEVGEARDALRPVGEADAKIQIIGGTDLRVQSQTTDSDSVADVRAALSELTGVDTGEIGLTTVGPSWGDEITGKAVRALVFFFVAIALYITVRLEWKMAMAALIALLHDIIITVGSYAVFQFEVTPATVIAFLTILGYSLYDTIVVFDKVKENEQRVGNRLTYTGMVNRSMNQVMMRSLNTTITSVLPVLSLLVIGALVLGAVTLQEFSIALLVGLLSGAFSSIFIAAPLLSRFKEREPQFVLIRERVEAREGPIDGGDQPSEPADQKPSADDGPQPARRSPRTPAGADRAETVARAATGTAIPRGRKRRRKN